jgi:hypothetical protein
VRHLADEKLKEKEDKKRKDDDILAEDARVSKRHCMDGSNHVERVVGEPIPIEFPQALYDSEICVAVPLPFFLMQNLWSLVDEASTLPTVKSNPVPQLLLPQNLLTGRLSGQIVALVSVSPLPTSKRSASTGTFEVLNLNSK